MTPVKTAPAWTPACAPGAIAGGLTRTRFFDGMFLTQSDLENEQRYWRIKRRLTNRALGEGVVWGLRLSWNAARHTFTLSPGYAIDCCGNDLVVECPIEISERDLWQLADPSLRAVMQPGNAFRTNVGRDACVVLQYVECPEEARPVHQDACGGATTACESSRVRETVRLLLVPPRSRPLSPPELFWNELVAFRDGLPADVRDLLFPPVTQPQPQPSAPESGVVPVSLTVTVPDSPDASATIQPRLGQSTTVPELVAHQAPPASRASGVVTFELRPDAGWGFVAGEVRDGTRVVERVSPPVAMSMYWSLDVAVPPPGSSETMSFEFVVDQLGLEEMFGGHRVGHATFVVKGGVVVKSVDGGGVDVRVDKLTVIVQSADIVEGGLSRSCFADVVPWGWAADLADGSEIAKTLVLAALHAALSEAVARGATPAWQQLAYALYVAAWMALFGVNVRASVDDAYRRQLIGVLLGLLERWCTGFAYPGPRCIDEHHGVYLGCGELSASGTFSSFDMWTGRRYVLTGPLFTHWAGLFGIAPVDVIAGRFAAAICCLSGQPALKLPPRTDGTITVNRPVAAESVAIGSRVVAGSSASIAEAARARGVPLRWVASDELLLRAAQLFVRADLGGPAELVATNIANGGLVALLVPTPAASSAGATSIRDHIAAGLRSGPARVSSRVRGPLAELAAAISNAAPVSTLVAPDASAAVGALAKQLDAAGVSVGQLLDAGADDALATVGADANEPATRDAAFELVDSAEESLDRMLAGLAKASAPGIGAGIEDAAFLKRATNETGKAFVGKVPPGLVKAAAKAVAGQ